MRKSQAERKTNFGTQEKKEKEKFEESLKKNLLCFLFGYFLLFLSNQISIKIIFGLELD